MVRGSAIRHENEPLLDASEVKALVDPTDLGRKSRSPFQFMGHPPIEFGLGDSIIMDTLDPLRDGILKLFCVIVGEESGEDWSGRVEWWRFVHARAKSKPLE